MVLKQKHHCHTLKDMLHNYHIQAFYVDSFVLLCSPVIKIVFLCIKKLSKIESLRNRKSNSLKTSLFLRIINVLTKIGL